VIEHLPITHETLGSISNISRVILCLPGVVVQAYNPSYLGELKFEVSWEKKLVRLQSQPIKKKKKKSWCGGKCLLAQLQGKCKQEDCGPD
jgi:hypothetical protein